MMLLWLVAGFAALVAILAYASVRRLSGKLAQLHHSYWELRYQYSELRARLSRLDPEPPPHTEPDPPAPSGSFVPLSSIKR